MDWLNKNIIYITLHGSQAYGLANELSDVDVKGICIPPFEVEYNLFNRFEQIENYSEIEKSLSHIKNPKNPKLESVIYSLKKFFVLASEVNPNIIELLWTDPKHHCVFNDPMSEIIANRNLFLSNRAKYTFSGYACAQAKKIERHRKWIEKGTIAKPDRKDFGLPEVKQSGVEEIFGYIRTKIEEWNLNQFPIDEMLRSELKNNIWDLLTNITQQEVSIANCPDVYTNGIINKMAKEFNLKDEVIHFIHAERNYAKAKQIYNGWIAWKEERNPERRALEEKSGYDTKHASHLVRLMRMGYEILSEGKVIVNRPDADELLAIKNGAWSYDKVMEYKEALEAKLEIEYNRQKKLIADGKPTPLPNSVNKIEINKLYHKIYGKYWNE